MAVVAPWLKPANVTEAQSAGAQAGLSLRGLRQRANEALLAHSARMAGIAASSQTAAARNQLAREQLQQRDREAALSADISRQNISRLGEQERGKLSLEQAKLTESGRQADLKAAGETPFTYVVAGPGKVLKVNKRTGDYESLDFPELRKKNSPLSLLEGEAPGLEDAGQPAAPQVAPQAPPPRNTFFAGTPQGAPNIPTGGTFFAGNPNPLMTGPNPRQQQPSPASDISARFEAWKRQRQK